MEENTFMEFEKSVPRKIFIWTQKKGSKIMDIIES
jgi:hypothetical protein